MHQYPLLPIRSKPGWFRCRRCGQTFSEQHPTEMSSPDCVPGQAFNLAGHPR